VLISRELQSHDSYYPYVGSKEYAWEKVWQTMSHQVDITALLEDAGANPTYSEVVYHAPRMLLPSKINAHMVDVAVSLFGGLASKDWPNQEKVLFALTRTLNIVDPDNEDTCDSIGIYSLLSASSTDLDSFSMALANDNGVVSVGTNTIRAYDTSPAPGSKTVTTQSADEDTVTTVEAKASATGSTLSTQRATGRGSYANAAAGRNSYANAARRALKLPTRVA
jgi:hypothetical protein